MNSDQKLFQVFFTLRTTRYMEEGPEHRGHQMSRLVLATSEDEAIAKARAVYQKHDPYGENVDFLDAYVLPTIE